MKHYYAIDAGSGLSVSKPFETIELRETALRHEIELLNLDWSADLYFLDWDDADLSLYQVNVEDFTNDQ